MKHIARALAVLIFVALGATQGCASSSRRSIPTSAQAPSSSLREQLKLASTEVRKSKSLELTKVDHRFWESWASKWGSNSTIVEAQLTPALLFNDPSDNQSTESVDLAVRWIIFGEALLPDFGRSLKVSGRPIPIKNVSLAIIQEDRLEVAGEELRQLLESPTLRRSFSHFVLWSRTLITSGQGDDQFSVHDILSAGRMMATGLSRNADSPEMTRWHLRDFCVLATLTGRDDLVKAGTSEQKLLKNALDWANWLEKEVANESISSGFVANDVVWFSDKVSTTPPVKRRPLPVAPLPGLEEFRFPAYSTLEQLISESRSALIRSEGRDSATE